MTALYTSVVSLDIQPMWLQVQTEADGKDYQLTEEEDSESLVNFLRNIEPVISKALTRNAHSTAFDGNKNHLICKLDVCGYRICRN